MKILLTILLYTMVLLYTWIGWDVAVSGEPVFQGYLTVLIIAVAPLVGFLYGKIWGRIS